MPYLPVSVATPTVLPAEYGKDLLFSVRLIEEQFRRFHPRLNYYFLKKSGGARVDLQTPVGAAGETKLDPLYLEPVDETMTIVTQPHLSNQFAATEVEKYDGPYPLNARVYRESQDLDLKKYGFDKYRGLIVSVPLSFLDTLNQTVSEGDRFTWGLSDYDVMEAHPVGYWKNSNQPLYMAMNCQNRRKGS